MFGWFKTKTIETAADIPMAAHMPQAHKAELVSLQSRTHRLGKLAKRILFTVAGLGVAAGTVALSGLFVGDNLYFPPSFLALFPETAPGAAHETFLFEKLFAVLLGIPKFLFYLVPIVSGIYLLFRVVSDDFQTEEPDFLIKKHGVAFFGFLISCLVALGIIGYVNVLPEKLPSVDQSSAVFWFETQRFPVVNQELGQDKYRDVLGVRFINAQKAVDEDYTLKEESLYHSLNDGRAVFESLPVGSEDKYQAARALLAIADFHDAYFPYPEVNAYLQSHEPSPNEPNAFYRLSAWVISCLAGILAMILSLKLYLDRRLKRIVRLLSPSSEA